MHAASEAVNGPRDEATLGWYMALLCSGLHTVLTVDSISVP